MTSQNGSIDGRDLASKADGSVYPDPEVPERLERARRRQFTVGYKLRIREPELKRQFRVPGGLTAAITCGIFPLLLLSLAMVESEHESVLGMNGLAFGALIIVAGFVAWPMGPRGNCVNAYHRRP